MGNIDFGHLFFGFDGRINRGKYWAGVLTLAVIQAIVAGVARDSAGTGLAIWYALVVLVLIWPYLAIAVKRWHDRDKSGWWVLIALIPIIGWLWALIETGFLLGTDGPNQYGPNPLDPSTYGRRL